MAFRSRSKATPKAPTAALSSKDLRVRHDRIDNDGKLTLRYRSKLHHIGMGRALRGVRVVILVADTDVRIVSEDGEVLRAFTLDPTRDYQPQARP